MKLKQILSEGHEVEKLVNHQSFKKIEEVDKHFAANLKRAWEGDVREYQKGSKNIDSLFDKMLTLDNLRKLAPLAANLTREAQQLADLHRSSFPSHVKRPSDTDLWQHERHSR